MVLYLLVLTDQELSYDDYSEDFYIGLFATEVQAEEAACPDGMGFEQMENRRTKMARRICQNG